MALHFTKNYTISSPKCQGLKNAQKKHRRKILRKNEKNEKTNIFSNIKPRREIPARLCRQARISPTEGSFDSAAEAVSAGSS